MISRHGLPVQHRQRREIIALRKTWRFSYYTCCSLLCICIHPTNASPVTQATTLTPLHLTAKKGKGKKQATPETQDPNIVKRAHTRPTTKYIDIKGNVIQSRARPTLPRAAMMNPPLEHDCAKMNTNNSRKLLRASK